MFSGIVEHVGVVRSIRRGARAHAAARIELDIGALSEGLRPGASVAVNGVCLTVVSCGAGQAVFDAVPETLARTNLGELSAGCPVNLERSLRVGDRVDGHFVQGHIDAIGVVERVQRAADDWRMTLRLPREVEPYVVHKGSVAIDGVSLTVADVHDTLLSVALIPETLARTTLGRRDAGDSVNVETDMLARLVVSRLAALTSSTVPAASRVTWDTLREQGFVR